MATLKAVPIVERMLIRDHAQEVVFRVVAIDSIAKQVWLCRVDDDSWPRPMPINRLMEELDPEKGHFTLEPADLCYISSNNPLEKSATDKLHEQRYALIEPLVTGDNEGLILLKHHCKKLADQRLKEVKSTRQTIYALLKLWWKGGMTFNALRPDYANCGGRGKTRNTSGEKKIGRPRIITPGIGITVNANTRKIMCVAADFWLTRKQPTLQAAIDNITDIYFSEPVKDEKGRVVTFNVNHDKKPTVRQLQYFIQTNYSHSHIRRRRYGDKNWNLQERPLLGIADADAQGPGDIFQVDATIADVYLVSQFDPRRIVGRPIIYFIVDVFSSLIVGIYVGFEGPSWIGAMMALVNMVTPKIQFCKQYGIEIEESEWPSHHACKRLSADRGELMSVDLGKNITKSLRIQIENPGSGRPDLKALVERRFGIVPAKYRQFTPGYVEKDFNERGVHDYRLDACLNLHQFTQLVIYAVQEHNFTPIRDKRMPAAMITDGLEASPIDLWEWGVENLSGSLKTLTVEEVALNVMPTAEARVTANGIRLFKGGFYSCATAMREEWFAKARHREWNVTMSFDPRSMEHAYLRDPKLPRSFEVCGLLERCYDYRGKSLFEIEELDLARKKAEAAGENNRQEKRIFYDQRMAEIQKEAKRAAKAVKDPSASKAERTAKIRDNRAQEKEIQRGAESFDLRGVTAANSSIDSCEISTAPPFSNRREENALALLEHKRKIREEKRNDKKATS